MIFYGIPVVDLSEEEKERYESQMKELVFAISEIANKLKMSPVAFRNFYKQNSGDDPICIEASKFMQEMISIEETVLAAWVRVIYKKICCNNYPGVTEYDLVQEAAIGVYDAQYSYDGSARFSTHSYVCASRRITKFLKTEIKQNGRRDASIIKLDFDVLKEETPDISKELFEILEKTDLSLIERELIEAVLNDEKGFRTNLLNEATKVAAYLLRQAVSPLVKKGDYKSAIEKFRKGRKIPDHIADLAISQTEPVVVKPIHREVINSKTFAPVTRAWLSQIYISACSKIRKAA